MEFELFRTQLSSQKSFNSKILSCSALLLIDKNRLEGA